MFKHTTRLAALLALSLFVGTAAASLDDGLIAHWSFDSMYDDGGVMKVADLTGNDYTLKLRNGASVVTDAERGGVLNTYSATQRSTAQLIGANRDLKLSEGSFTVSTWFNRTHNTNSQGGGGWIMAAHYIGSNYDDQGWNFGAWSSVATMSAFVSYGHNDGPRTDGAYTNRTVDYDWGKIPGVENPTFENNQWYHCVVTFDADRPADGTTIYINGQAIRQGSNIWDIKPTEYPIGIGCSGFWDDSTQTPHDCFPGMIDETRFYSRALSAEEVAQLAGTGGDVPEPTTLLAAFTALAAAGRYACRRNLT